MQPGTSPEGGSAELCQQAEPKGLNQVSTPIPSERRAYIQMRGDLWEYARTCTLFDYPQRCVEVPRPSLEIMHNHTFFPSDFASLEPISSVYIPGVPIGLAGVIGTTHATCLQPLFQPQNQVQARQHLLNGQLPLININLNNSNNMSRIFTAFPMLLHK